MERLLIGPSASTQDLVIIDPANDVAISVIKSGKVKFSIGSSGVGFNGNTPTAQQANIEDATTVHSLSALFVDTEVATALDDLGAKINSILAVLEAYGFTATS